MNVTRHHYPLNLFWSAEDDGFIAEVPGLPGCSAWGRTKAEVAREAQDAIAARLEAARAAGHAGNPHMPRAARK